MDKIWWHNDSWLQSSWADNWKIIWKTINSLSFWACPLNIKKCLFLFLFSLFPKLFRCVQRPETKIPLSDWDEYVVFQLKVGTYHHHQNYMWFCQKIVKNRSTLAADFGANPMFSMHETFIIDAPWCFLLTLVIGSPCHIFVKLHTHTRKASVRDYK